jgi:uncharacterized protein with ATP-grasp and redox domains
MKARPDCIVCMFRQALNTARLVSDDPDVHYRVLNNLAARVVEQSFDQTPAALSKPAYEAVAEVTGVMDPYKAQRAETNAAALALLPRLRELVSAAADPLDAAVHAAAAGNIIDLGIGHEFDIERDVVGLMCVPFGRTELDSFRKELGPGRKLLFLGDNAGEIVFDTLLVEQILGTGTDVVYVVKSAPIINDAVMADAEEAGMTKLTRVITTGSDDIGVNWDNIADSFAAAAASADVILGKGHGNFETCSDRPEAFYFLLKAKCPMVAEELGVKLGEIVFAKGPKSS